MPKIADDGITVLWLPPPSDSVSPQGYLPRDLYDLDSAYGSEVRPRCSTAQDNTMPAFPACRSYAVQGATTIATRLCSVLVFCCPAVSCHVVAQHLVIIIVG